MNPTHLHSRLLLLLSLLLSPHLPAVAGNTTAFDSGVRAYRAGDFSGAATSFVQSVHESGEQPGVLHNLGNAAYRQGKLPEAILFWHRAQAANPTDARNTVANLRYAREKHAIPSMSPTWWEAVSLWLPGWVWSLLFVSTLWCGIAFSLTPWLLRRTPRAWQQVGTAVCASVTLLLLAPIFGLVCRGSWAVVMAPDTRLLLTPTEDGETLGELVPGEVVRIERSHKTNYYYARGENDRAGWVKGDRLRRILE